MSKDNNKHINVKDLMSELTGEQGHANGKKISSDLFEIQVPGLNDAEMADRAREILARGSDDKRPKTVNSSLVAALKDKIAASGSPGLNTTGLSHLSPQGSAFHVNELLGFQDKDFISKAYEVILGRSPDKKGEEHFTAQLRSGKMTKNEILGRLRYSREGRSKNVRLHGLFFPFVMHTIRHVPFLGRLLYTGYLAASLPERVRDLHLLENTYYRAMQDIDRRTQEHLQLLMDTIDQQEKWLDDLDSDLRDFRIEVMSRFTKSIEHSEKGKETRQIPFGLYADLEEAFRGSREDIISRLKTYLPLLQESMTATQNAPVVDLGSGRGEWLELCAQEGVKALGIDFNPLFVKQCREKGLTIQESDVFEFLDATEKNSLGLVTAFHLIEHLSPLRLAVFVEQVHRALAPGGIAIFETPNPENVLVGSHNFYVDPTHGNPIPPVTAAFLLERCGFEQVKIERLHPDERRSFSDEELNQLLRGPQDYAVIGYKGTSAS